MTTETETERAERLRLACTESYSPRVPTSGPAITVRCNHCGTEYEVPDGVHVSVEAFCNMPPSAGLVAWGIADDAPLDRHGRQMPDPDTTPILHEYKSGTPVCTVCRLRVIAHEGTPDVCCYCHVASGGTPDAEHERCTQAVERNVDGALTASYERFLASRNAPAT